MSARTRLKRQQKHQDATAGGLIAEFIRCLQKHEQEPVVDAAVDIFWPRMQAAEAALGHKVTPREWLNDPWMERHGLTDAINGLFRAVREAEATVASQQGGVP
jgi:hypothetical protein